MWLHTHLNEQRREEKQRSMVGHIGISCVERTQSPFFFPLPALSGWSQTEHGQ
jgi:hypothetical protein